MGGSGFGMGVSLSIDFGILVADIIEELKKKGLIEKWSQPKIYFEYFLRWFLFLVDFFPPLRDLNQFIIRFYIFCLWR